MDRKFHYGELFSENNWVPPQIVDVAANASSPLRILMLADLELSLRAMKLTWRSWGNTGVPAGGARLMVLMVGPLLEVR